MNEHVRLEPEASVIAEGLEAFAIGNLSTQAEFARWLTNHPNFSKGRGTRITNQQAHNILTNCVYGGVVEMPDWGVNRRKGRHEGLVSYETFERVQKRLKEGSRVPMRADLNLDFPLRGAVVCACCDHPLTACWSTSKTGVKHPYYMCFKAGCSEYRKSIRRDVIEGEFTGVLDQLTPSGKLMDLAKAMFKDAWEQRSAQASAMAAQYKRELATVETSIARLVDRIVESTTDAVVRACEARIAEHERTKLVLIEKAGQQPMGGKFDELFELAFEFLANPCRLWDSGRYEYRRLVLRMTFSDKLAYSAKTGFRTPETTMPFNVLGGLRDGVGRMAVGVVQRKQAPFWNRENTGI
ncbi:MAG: recombinase family protein [Devosia sp.]